MVKPVRAEDFYTEQYAYWASDYHATVLSVADSVLRCIDTSFDDEIEPEGDQITQQMQHETEERSDQYWFDSRMSQEHAAFICLVNSSHPSAELFNSGANADSAQAEFPFATFAAEAFELDVIAKVHELAGYAGAEGPWFDPQWKKAIDIYCEAKKAEKVEEQDG